MSRSETPRWEVELQPHLRHRMRERCPQLKPARAVDEVREAISAGRISVQRPAWLEPVAPHPRADISLYAWTADEGRAYILHATLNAFVVMSVLTPR